MVLWNLLAQSPCKYNVSGHYLHRFDCVNKSADYQCCSFCPVPTISVANANITIREGESATLSCIPSDPRVQLEWSTSPPSSNFSSLEESPGVVYDSDLRHSLTLLAPSLNAQNTYYCYVRGDGITRTVSPGAISLTIRSSECCICSLCMHCAEYLQTTLQDVVGWSSRSCYKLINY